MMRATALLLLAPWMVLTGCTSDTDPLASARASIEAAAPGTVVDEVAPSAVPGLVEVVSGTDVVYITGDGKYLISGAVMELESKRNVTEERQSSLRAKLLNQIPAEDTIRYKPDGLISKTIHVFTDPSCPYCQRFHEEVPKLTSAGVEVVYLGFPREGLGGPVHKQLTSAFCAPYKNKALDSLLAGGQIDEQRCLSPIDLHMSVVERLRLSGTPAIFSSDGKQIGGYLTAAEVLRELDQ